MHLTYIVLPDSDCISDLNKIKQLPRNLERDSMNGFDRSDNVECTDAGVSIKYFFLINTPKHDDHR